MMAGGKMIKFLAMENIVLLMEIDIKEISTREDVMDMDFINIKMVENTKEIGKTIKKKVKEHLLCMMEIIFMDSGSMA